jgi:hypothetical protein
VTNIIDPPQADHKFSVFNSGFAGLGFRSSADVLTARSVPECAKLQQKSNIFAIQLKNL